MSATRATDEAHRHHLQTDGENVPDETRAELLSVASDLATAEARGELMGVIEAAYSLTGRWEEFLSAPAVGDGTREEGR